MTTDTKKLKQIISKQDVEQVELHLRDINISENQVKPIIIPIPLYY